MPYVCLIGYLLARWRFPACLVFALLLGATDMPAATITVTNGNDSGAGSLRQAIIAASPGDTINFAPSVTTITLTSGELVINKNLTITGPGANRLTVEVNTNVISARVFNITSSTAVSISGMTISNGFPLDGLGAGILSAGLLILTDSTVSGNQAAFGGAGGGVMNDNGTMTITRCTISNNSATGESTPNTQLAPEGGGIFNNSKGSLTITNSTISDNSCFFSSIGIFQSFAAGGGVLNSGSMTITNCTISGNSVGGSGLVTMYGGGIGNSGDLQITSSTIAHNSASGGNGAFGGGIYGFGPTTTPRTNSSIIALNSAPIGPDFTGAGGLQSTGYNIIGNNADAVINSQPTDQIGTPAAPIDPLLGTLADNGGPTLTHALQSGSPAINRGDPVHSPAWDQRGYGRVGVPDVGAFEFNAGFPRYDFNSDGKPDYVLYNASTRQTAIWYMDNNVNRGRNYGPTLPVGWKVIDEADFNRDAHPDYLLYNGSTHQTAIWYLNNSDYRGGAYGPSVPTGWQPVATADFNGDGKPDYALYNSSTRQTAIWYLNNNVYVRGVYGPTLPVGWRLVGSTDFDGDRKPDYLLFNSITRQSAIWYLNNNVFVSGLFGPTIANGWALVVTADFNSDGHPDYVLYNPANRQTAIWYLNNNVYISAAYGPTPPAGWSLVTH